MSRTLHVQAAVQWPPTVARTCHFRRAPLLANCQLDSLPAIAATSRPTRLAHFHSASAANATSELQPEVGSSEFEEDSHSHRWSSRKRNNNEHSPHDSKQLKKKSTVHTQETNWKQTKTHSATPQTASLSSTRLETTTVAENTNTQQTSLPNRRPANRSGSAPHLHHAVLLTTPH